MRPGDYTQRHNVTQLIYLVPHHGMEQRIVGVRSLNSKTGDFQNEP